MLPCILKETIRGGSADMKNISGNLAEILHDVVCRELLNRFLQNTDKAVDE